MRSTSRRVYPRVCGGTERVGDHLIPVTGLSPRVRGNHVGMRPVLDGLGSIPACAGEPAPVASRRSHHRVYPRVCGGTDDGRPSKDPLKGLSPRVRGNRRHRQRPPPRAGSIPACAGEPDLPSGIVDRFRVYPRVCGGTRPRTQSLHGIKGLSPRVRGNLRVVADEDSDIGSIPACAGEPPAIPAARRP